MYSNLVDVKIELLLVSNVWCFGTSGVPLTINNETQ